MWSNVEVDQLDYSQLPRHVQEARICAFKPAVVLQALDKGSDRVIWMDANFELRYVQSQWRLSEKFFLGGEPNVVLVVVVVVIIHWLLVTEKSSLACGVLGISGP